MIIKKCFLLLVISTFFVSGCVPGNEEELGAEVEKVEAATDVNKKGHEQKAIPLTLQAAEDVVKDSEWYKEAVYEREILFEEFIDFDGDETKEYIIGTQLDEGESTQIDIGKFFDQKEEWGTLSSDVHDIGTYTEPKFYGILNNGNGEEVAIISIMTAGGSGLYEDMRIWASKEENEQLVISNIFKDQNEEATPPHTYSVDETTNSFTISTEHKETTYKLEENKLIKDNGEIIELVFDETEIISERLAIVLNNPFYNSGVNIGMNIEIAKNLNSDWVHQGEAEGGLTVEYEDYALIHGYDDPYISTVALYNFDELSINDLEEALSQEIEQVSYYNEMEAREIVSAEFTFDRVRYTLELSSAAEDAPVEIIYLSMIQ